MKLKEHLSRKSKADLVREIIGLSKRIPNVQHYYSNLLGKNEDVLGKFKKAIKQEYFPSRGFGKARAGEIRKIISDFRQISRSARDMVDLFVFHAEQGVEFTNEYGDIDERFYSSIESSFDSAMKLIRKERLHREFQARCLKIVEDTDGIGWGFHDCLADMYYSTFEDD